MRYSNRRAASTDWLISETLLLYTILSLFFLNLRNAPQVLTFSRYFTKETLEYEEKAKQICGDVEFFKNGHLAEIAKANAKKLSNCDYCNVVRHYSGSNSTENDVAFAYLMGNTSHNILNWVRTLRSAQCHCSIIFLVTQKLYDLHHESVWRDLSNCGVTIQVVPYHSDNIFNDVRMCRKIIEYVFAEYCSMYFDRMMFSDIYDSIFQKDPFIKNAPQDKISMSIERVTFANHDWEKYFMSAYFSSEFANLLANAKKFLINGGFVIGKGYLMAEFYHTVISLPKFFHKMSRDQSYFNFAVYGKVFTKIWIDFNATYYASACYSIYEQRPRSDGYIYDWDTKTAPALIHQMDRICPIVQLIYKTCPTHNKNYDSNYRQAYIMQPCDSLANRNDRRFTYSANATIDL